MKYVFLLLVLNMSSPIIAENTYDLAILVGGGSSLVTGQLSVEDSVSISGVDLLIKIPKQNSFGFFALEMDSFTVDNDGGFYDPQIDDSLNISTTTIMPNACFWELFGTLHTCFGAGLKLIEVTSDDEKFRQQLGDFTYSLRFGSFRDEGFNYGIKASYTQVELTINDESDFFEIIPIAVQLGWGF
ncbi:MAG: hypothetical protein KBD78_13075 [Oligoflexales bacterium]|nr:hypothetical protein [Oligoflexales bacterium]